GSSTNANNSTNWGGALPNSTIDVILKNGLSNYPILSNSLDVKNIEFETGSSLRISSGRRLRVFGNLSVEMSGTLDPGDGTIEFAGSDSQVVSGSINSHVKIDNSNDLQIEDDVYFKSVEFTNGDIDLGNNDIYLSGTSTGADASSYFKISGDGTLNSYLDASAKTFDVGFNPYLPVTIECPDCDGSELFEVSVSDLAYQNPEISDNQVSSNIVTNTWKITTDAAHDVTVTFQWNSSDEENLGTAINLSQWQEGIDNSWNTGSVTTKTGSGPYTITQTITAMNGGYYFVVGNQSTVLPVDLTHFQASWLTIGQSAKLDWQTAMEENNSHFEVERSFDGINYETIGRVEGFGTTFETQNYQFIDRLESPSHFGEGFRKGQLYYRLKQVDYNGEFEYSKVEVLDFGDNANHLVVRIMPNPVKDYFTILSNLNSEFSFQLYNANGAILKEGTQPKVDVSDL
ncbi:MAG: hypothetical protein ACPGLV_18765, partial [Bacteroidia bacterium]